MIKNIFAVIGAITVIRWTYDTWKASVDLAADVKTADSMRNRAAS